MVNRDQRGSNPKQNYEQKVNEIKKKEILKRKIWNTKKTVMTGWHLWHSKRVEKLKEQNNLIYGSLKASMIKASGLCVNYI